MAHWRVSDTSIRITLTSNWLGRCGAVTQYKLNILCYVATKNYLIKVSFSYGHVSRRSFQNSNFGSAPFNGWQVNRFSRCKITSSNPGWTPYSTRLDCRITRASGCPVANLDVCQRRSVPLWVEVNGCWLLQATGDVSVGLSHELSAMSLPSVMASSSSSSLSAIKSGEMPNMSTSYCTSSDEARLS